MFVAASETIFQPALWIKVLLIIIGKELLIIISSKFLHHPEDILNVKLVKVK
jgi:hypothetical protein